jgi:hypothetical protein
MMINKICVLLGQTCILFAIAIFLALTVAIVIRGG